VARSSAPRGGPLCINGADEAWGCIEEWQQEVEASHREVVGPPRLDLAPDYLHKANISGGEPYGFTLGIDEVDPIFEDEEHALPFVDYLRLCFRLGGFPRLERVEFGDEGRSTHSTSFAAGSSSSEASFKFGGVSTPASIRVDLTKSPYAKCVLRYLRPVARSPSTRASPSTNVRASCLTTSVARQSRRPELRPPRTSAVRGGDRAGSRSPRRATSRRDGDGGSPRSPRRSPADEARSCPGLTPRERLAASDAAPRCGDALARTYAAGAGRDGSVNVVLPGW
jgi:hypothetical protein